MSESEDKHSDESFLDIIWIYFLLGIDFSE